MTSTGRLKSWIIKEFLPTTHASACESSSVLASRSGSVDADSLPSLNTLTNRSGARATVRPTQA